MNKNVTKLNGSPNANGKTKTPSPGGKQNPQGPGRGGNASPKESLKNNIQSATENGQDDGDDDDCPDLKLTVWDKIMRFFYSKHEWRAYLAKKLRKQNANAKSAAQGSKAQSQPNTK